MKIIQGFSEQFFFSTKTILDSWLLATRILYLKMTLSIHMLSYMYAKHGNLRTEILLQFIYN